MKTLNLKLAFRSSCLQFIYLRAQLITHNLEWVGNLGALRDHQVMMSPNIKKGKYVYHEYGEPRMKESLLGKMDVHFRAPLVILFIGLFSRSYLIPRSNTDTSNSNNLSEFPIKTESTCLLGFEAFTSSPPATFCYVCQIQVMNSTKPNFRYHVKIQSWKKTVQRSIAFDRTGQPMYIFHTDTSYCSESTCSLCNNRQV